MKHCKPINCTETINKPELKLTIYLHDYAHPISGDIYPAAIAYKGHSSKSFFNTLFKSVESREKFINEKIELLTKRELQKQIDKEKRKQETAKFLEALRPGTILSDSWGYDQTNVEFYKVIRRKGHKVTIGELGHKQVEGSGSFMSCKVTPSDNFTDAPITVNIRGPWVKIDSCVSLSLWHGEAVYKSWYA